MQDLTIKILHGNEARPYLQQIAQIRIELFREFPYLYEGTLESEQEYLGVYFQAESSTILLAFDGDELVAFSSSVALADEMEEIKRPFMVNHLPLNEYFYVGELMIKPEYRRINLFRKFVDYQQQLAKERCFKHIVFMTVQREFNHPMRPNDYQALEQLWQRLGYQLLPDMLVEIPWLRVDSKIEENNILNIWHKKI